MIVGGGIRVAERRTHLGVYALLMYGDAVILVRKGRGPYSGKWDLPGGRIEFGEAPQEALEREVRWTPIVKVRTVRERTPSSSSWRKVTDELLNGTSDDTAGEKVRKVRLFAVHHGGKRRHGDDGPALGDELLRCSAACAN